MDVLLICFSAASFLGFGLACFLWPPMQREYVRYGVSQLRPLVGSLQIAGGLGSWLDSRLLSSDSSPPPGSRA